VKADRGAEAIRIAFERAAIEHRAALIPYVALGHPTPERSIALAEAAIDGGADLLELGIPFSDPLADGPVIQRATQRALAAGTTVRVCLDLARRIREAHPETPLLFMGYLNPILAFGERAFCAACRDAGVDGLIVPDLPPDEGGALEILGEEHGLALVYLAAPNTPDARLRIVCSRSTGYVYLVSLTGTTGPRERLPAELPRAVERVRAMTDKPVAVGFGIGSPAQAGRVAAVADGVIIGSAVVDRCDREDGPEAVRRFVSELREAMARR